MAWLLVLHWWAFGTPVLIVHRFESETICQRAAVEIEETLPKGNAASSSHWKCTNLYRVE